jgi:hypothetical protein
MGDYELWLSENYSDYAEFSEVEVDEDQDWLGNIH